MGNILNEMVTVNSIDDSMAVTLIEAVKRIEEANLWKTLITTDVFEVGSARPQIVEEVNRQIKEFAQTRLEICVGLRPSSQQQNVAQVFDDEEVQALKVLAAKLLKRDPITSIPQYNPTLKNITVTNTTLETKQQQNNEFKGNNILNKAANNVNRLKKSKITRSDKTQPGYIPQPVDYTPSVSPIGNISGNLEEVDGSQIISQIIANKVSK